MSVAGQLHSFLRVGREFAPLLLAMGVLTVVAGCGGSSGGGGGSTPPASPTITSVTVSCSPASILTNQTSTCTPTVNGTGSFSSSVTWSVSPTSMGAISNAGVFTPSGAGMATITATSAQDTTKFGSTTVPVSTPSTISNVSVTCASASVPTGQNSQCSATVTGTGSYSSAVTWSVDSGKISSSGLYTAPTTIPVSGSAAVKATSVQDSTKSGTTTISITASSASNGTLVIIATPSNGGPGNGPWALSIAAKDSAGNPLSGVAIALSASEGSLSPGQGVTDTNGWFTAAISPPSTYSGEAVAISATGNNETAAVDIVFVPYSFSPAVVRSAKALIASPEGTGTASATLTTPFLFGTNSTTGANIPWLTPNVCFSNVSLESTVPANCQAILAGNSLAQLIPNAANMVCKTIDTATNLAGAASCVGIAATIVSCVASPTGIGAVICAGGLTYSATLSSLCVGYITDVIAQFISKSQLDQQAMTMIAAGIEPGPPSLGDDVDYACEAVTDAAIGHGTGAQGTTVTITPSRTSSVLGNTIQFSAQTSDHSSVDWSVNGVLGATGQFGSIASNGLFTAPSVLPIPNYVTVSATSQSDQTASAPSIVQILPAAPGTVTTIAGDGIAGYSGDGGGAVAAKLSNPSGIAFDGGGNMFIADTSNNVIRRVDASTKIITTIAGTGTAGYSGDGSAGTNAELNQPTHVVFDRTVNLYITDANNERIRKVDAISDEITTVAGNGTAGFSGDGGPATSAELNFPDGVALDTNGNLYIGDARNNRIREVALSSGTITTVAGNGAPGYSGDGSLATNAELDFPSRPFVDAAGNIYIADYQNNRVRKVNVTTGIVTTIVGTGVAGYAGDGGSATSAELNGPLSVAVDSSGVLYIADVNNERIRAVNTTANPLTVFGVAIQPGQIQTVVGNGQAGYYGDGGAGTNAEVNSPTGLMIDSAGSLYFADAHNNVVRKVIGQ